MNIFLEWVFDFINAIHYLLVYWLVFSECNSLFFENNHSIEYYKLTYIVVLK